MPDSRWKLVSIRTLCEEGEPRRKSRSNLWSIFLSTPSARRATERPIRQALELSISIHALREEGDDRGTAPSGSRRYFYPRPLRGGRQHAACGDHAVGLFLSTPSARRATEGDFLFIGWCCNFYPRPPRGGRRLVPEKKGRCRIFLSTPSARRATLTRKRSDRWSSISIHALREEGDSSSEGGGQSKSISIHALREEGDVGGAGRKPSKNISIHALREEGDHTGRSR